MYKCPHCGAELTEWDVSVEVRQGCNLGETRSGTETVKGHLQGKINWEGLWDACRQSEEDEIFTCDFCDHELSEEDILTLLLTNAQEKTNE